MSLAPFRLRQWASHTVTLQFWSVKSIRTALLLPCHGSCVLPQTQSIWASLELKVLSKRCTVKPEGHSFPFLLGPDCIWQLLYPVLHCLLDKEAEAGGFFSHKIAFLNSFSNSKILWEFIQRVVCLLCSSSSLNCVSDCFQYFSYQLICWYFSKRDSSTTFWGPSWL